MLCVALQKRERERERVIPRIPLWENGSINLELVKSLFISENEKDFGDRGRKAEEGKRETGKGGKERRDRENIHQQSNSRNLKK